jgi:hypothetical protein
VLRRRWAAVAAGTGIVATVLVVTLVARPVVHSLEAASACTVVAPSGTFHLSTSQAGYAATIAAVGERDGMPDHAVSVALATALQESKLRNLEYGDRDSLGLFQQRPSEGWGTAAEVQDPVYAANAFYRALAQVPGWEDVPVTVAAQDVQRSAAPLAYGSWESEGRALAEALTGEVPAALSCRYPVSGTAPSSSVSPAVSAAVADELGSPVPGTVVADAQDGWRLASWLVGRGQGLGIATVSWDGWTWTAATGRWVDTAVPALDEVTYTAAPTAAVS